MSQIFGKNTSIKDTNNKNLYEYDRVKFFKNNKLITGTVLNAGDTYHPEFKVLVDYKDWFNNTKPEWLQLEDNTYTLLEKGERFYKIHRNGYEFLEYCKKYKQIA